MPHGIAGGEVNPDDVGLTSGWIGYEQEFFARMDGGQVSDAIIEREPVYGGAKHGSAARGGRQRLGNRSLSA